MKSWIRHGIAALAIALSGCSSVSGKGILLAVEPATPLDQRDLHKHCDLGDQAACALSGRDGAKPAARFSVVQGVATPDRAVFAAVLPKDSSISWFIYDREVGRLWKLHDSRRQQRPGSAWYIQRVEARELEPGRKYELLAGDKDGNLVEDRSFRTLHVGEKTLRFAAVSGLGGGVGSGLVSATRGRKPHFVLFTGGNVDAYLPKKSAPAKRGAALDWFFERHLLARQVLALAREQELTPVAGIWNDPEFGVADGNRTFQFRDQAREVFEMFFPVWADETTIVNGPGVSKAFSLAGQRLALLDDLSFRHPSFSLPACSNVKMKSRRVAKPVECREARPDDTPRSRFGGIQASWAFSQAAKTSQPLWLISARSWLGILRDPVAGSSSLSAAEAWLAQIESTSGAPLAAPSQISIVESSPEGRGLRLQIATMGASGQELSVRQVSLP